ncbi:hypothetical protein B0J15DRAFT_406149, partial [Fusarium solani]
QKANLARIRDNQRRSRARRREYLQELEQRLRVYELRGVEASSEVQQAARRVAEENRQLRGLLSLNGITDEYISHYLHRDTATAQTDPTPIPHFPSRNPSEAVQSLQHVIAPRRPDSLDPGISCSMPSQISYESNDSTSISTLWVPGQAYQPGPANCHPLSGSISIIMVPSQMYLPQQICSLVPDTRAPPTEANDSVAELERPPKGA